MAYFQCCRCMKKYWDNRQDALACPYCHCAVRPYLGRAPAKFSPKPLLLIRRQHLYQHEPVIPRQAKKDALSETLVKFNVPLQNPSLPPKSIAARLSKLRRHYHCEPLSAEFADVSTMHVYPLILREITQLFERNNIEFVLYGSGALWLEGNARPQKEVHIKDLDMCVSCPPVKKDQMVRLIKKLLKFACSTTSIDFNNSEQFYVTKGNTMEFISPHEVLQFSFNLQSPHEFDKTKKLSKKISIFGDTQSLVNVAGLRFIAYRLFGDDALIATRLFRSDKTRQVLLYCSMVIGFDICSVDEVVSEICKYSIGLPTGRLIGHLKAVATNAYDHTQTAFYDAVEGMILDKFKRTVDSLERDNVRALKQYREGRIRLLKTMSGALTSAGVGASAREVNPVFAQAWKNTMGAEDFERRHGEAIANAEQELRSDTLVFLLTCLDDADNKLLESQWLSFEYFFRIKKGKNSLYNKLNHIADLS